MTNFSEKFSNPEQAQKIIQKIKEEVKQPLKFMEVCGTHTISVFRSGLRDLLLDTPVKLISGPGCPVCVTSQIEIDYAIELSKQPEIIFATFGDMLKVPGTNSSLSAERAQGAQIKIIYSPMSLIEICQKNPDKKVVFFSIGFETTVPTIAATLLAAGERNIENLYILPSHKLIPTAMEALLEHPEINIQGFLCPGHVSTIIGSQAYQPLVEKYHIPCVVGGFEPLDILWALWLLAKQNRQKKAKVENAYSRVVKKEGNPTALEKIYQVFKPCSANWRGLGEIPKTGLELQEEFKKFDIREKYQFALPQPAPHKNCLCDQILLGIKTPPQCPLFRKKCTPQKPFGPCMVSQEGTCCTYYKYHPAD